MNALIIEDEQLAQEELVRIIRKQFPQMRIVDILCSVKESIEWLNENEADLIFMDIHLSDGICFDIFKETELHTPIIFTTAYDQYAIQAFKVNGIGYLVKPIIEEELIQAVEKIKYIPLSLTKLLTYMQPSPHYKTRIVIKTGERISFLAIEEVAYFFAEDRFTFVMSKEGKRYIVDYTIEALAPLLDPKYFFKITRGCIVSISSIEKIHKYFNSRLKVSLKPAYEGELLISRVRVAEFIKWLNGE